MNETQISPDFDAPDGAGIIAGDLSFAGASTRVLALELVTDGLLFPEGPVAMEDGSVLVTEIARGTITRVAADGSKSVIAEVGAGPNGAAIGPDGALYVCNNGNNMAWRRRGDSLHSHMDRPPEYIGGSIQRVDLTSGEVTELYSHFEGERLVAPNDIVFDDAGGFWFTDFAGRAGQTFTLGAIYYGKINGSGLKQARRSLFGPNGIGLSPDGGELYFAETYTGRLFAAKITGQGELEHLVGKPGRLLVTLPELQAFDSLAVEENGDICVATCGPGSISVVSASGGLLEQIPVNDPVTTNICFGGADMTTAFITASTTGRLYRVNWPRPGLKLPFNG